MKNLFLISIFALSLAACKPAASKEEVVTAMATNVPEGFSDFYQRFMTDSIYQVEHILFPLQGLPDNADSSSMSDNTFRWQMQDWHMHHLINKSSGFEVSLRPITDTYIQENIRHQSGQYAMERRWAFMDDGWYLIYYAGLNTVN